MTLFTPTMEVTDVSGSYSSGLKLSTTFQYQTSTVTSNGGCQTSAFYRDPSAWYHLVYSLDQENDVAIGYVNGVEVMRTTDTLSDTFQAFGTNMGFGFGGTAYNFNMRGEGYVADVYLIDGQALEPSAFGEYDENGVWKPRKVNFGVAHEVTYSDYLTASMATLLRLLSLL